MSEEMEKDLMSEEASADTDASLAETPETVENTGNENAHWYVVHTYSGYENKVKANLAKKGKDTSKFGQGCCSSSEEKAADKILEDKKAGKEAE